MPYDVYVASNEQDCKQENAFQVLLTEGKQNLTSGAQKLGKLAQTPEN